MLGEGYVEFGEDFVGRFYGKERKAVYITNFEVIPWDLELKIYFVKYLRFMRQAMFCNI